VAGFPDLGLLRRLRPTPGPTADSEPARSSRAARGWFPRSSPTDRRGRRPAFPLQPRHETPQSFLMASAPATKFRRRSRPPTGACVHCSSAHIHQVGADAALEAVQPLVRSRYTFLSRLRDPGRLAVPTRPVVVGAAPIHALRFQSQTAPSFNDPLRQAAVGSLFPLGQSTPRGALRARSTTGQVAGAAAEKPGLQLDHRPKRPAPPAFSQKAPRPSRPNLSPPPDTTEALARAVSCPEKRQSR
jgi:hypothetical protein